MHATSGYYRVRFAADPVQLIFLRAGLAAWLRGLQWPEPARVDALLAITEVCTNAIQHAYGTEVCGEVEVVGRLVAGPTDRRIVVTVRDDGRWGSDRRGPGYGLRIVHECMADVRIRHDERGTAVTVTSRHVPLLDADGTGAGQAREDSAARGSRPGPR